MSNEEKKRREEYKLKRKKWIYIQSAIIAFFAILAIIMGSVYFQRSQTFYINYTESSKINYRVQYEKNSFYEEEWQTKGQDYVATLMENIEIEFDYRLDTDAQNVKYEYSYDITAKMDVREKGSTKELMPKETSILGDEAVSNKVQNSNDKLRIYHKIVISYDAFNDYVEGYLNNFKLDNMVSNLIVKMTINIKSTCDDFENDAHNKYEMSLVIPLAEQVVNIQENISVPSGSTKLLACESSLEKEAYKALTIVFGNVVVVLLLILLYFVLATRNTDVNYENQVKKILNNYKSFIQKIKTEINTEGYQVLDIDTFEELLEIRDTIQEPVLMFENSDKTCTSFMVLTNKNIIYRFEVKVDDYDEIYATQE
jgi:hypothetical protein